MFIAYFNSNHEAALQKEQGLDSIYSYGVRQERKTVLNL